MKNKINQKKTVANIEKSFKKKRMSKARREALNKACLARIAHVQHKKLLAQERLAEEEGSEILENKELAIIIASPNLPKPIPRAVTAFMSVTKDYLLERRIKAPQVTRAPNTVICHHPFTVGSSAAHRLFQRTYRISSAHKRSYYHGAVGDGAYWEDHVRKWSCFTYKQLNYKILEKHSQVTGLSSRYPWLVATPDFIMKLENKKESFYACVEVKSTTSPLTFRQVPQEFIMQL